MPQFLEDPLSMLQYMQGQQMRQPTRQPRRMSDRLQSGYVPTFPEDPSAMLREMDRAIAERKAIETQDRLDKQREERMSSQPVDQKFAVPRMTPSRAAMISETADQKPSAALPASAQKPEGLLKVLEQYSGKTGEELEAAGETPEIRASDHMLSRRRRLMEQNKRAQEGRIPGYMPGLEADEQKRVSDTLLRSARGGMVDETSPLNNRSGAYNELAGREAAKKAEQDQKMSARFRALQATRDPNAKVESSETSGWREAKLSGNRGGQVRTIAEKIAGVEDDPSTPMDESIRYRAEWTQPEAVEEAKASNRLKRKENVARRKEAQQQGRDAVSQALLAASAGQDVPVFEDPVLARIARKAYMRGTGRATSSDQGAGGYLTDEKAGQILQQARNQQLMTGGNEVAQALDYIKSERDRFTQREEANAGRQHDLMKIKAQGTVSERLQDKSISAESERDLRTQVFQAAQQAAKIAAEAEQRGLDRDTQMSLSKASNDLQRELAKAQMDFDKVGRILNNLQGQREALATVAAAGPDTVTGVKATRQMPDVEAKIEALLAQDSGKTTDPDKPTDGSMTANSPSVNNVPAVERPVAIPAQSQVEIDRVLSSGLPPQEQADAIIALVNDGVVSYINATRGIEGEDYAPTSIALRKKLSEKLREEAVGPVWTRGKLEDAVLKPLSEWFSRQWSGTRELSPGNLTPRQLPWESANEFADRMQRVNELRASLGAPSISGILRK